MVIFVYFSFIDDPNIRNIMRDIFGCYSGKKQIKERENAISDGCSTVVLYCGIGLDGMGLGGIHMG